MLKKMLVLTVLMSVSLSGCNMFRGLGQDIMNINHTFTKGVMPDGYPGDRQRVNYHQTQFAPYTVQRYYSSASMPAYY